MVTLIYLLAATGATGNAAMELITVPPPATTVVRRPPAPVVIYNPTTPSSSKRPNPIPTGNPGNWANTNDYPPIALRQELEGTTAFRLVVGPDGRVSDCQIMSTSGSPELDQATCLNVTRRARFDPALDTGGNPTSGTYQNRVRWQIPTDRLLMSFPTGPSPLNSGWTRVLPADYPQKALNQKHDGITKFDVFVSTDGTATGCSVIESSGHIDLDQKSCEIAIARGQFNAARDVNGQPALGRVRTQIAWQADKLVPDKPPFMRTPMDLFSKPGSVELTFIVNKDGSLTDCVAQKTGGPLAGNPEMLCTLGLKQKPFVNDKGEPVARRVRMKNTVELEEVK